MTPLEKTAQPAPFPVIVDRDTRMVAVVPDACNPTPVLLAIVQFRTNMVDVPPLVTAEEMPTPLFALTLSVTVMLYVWLPDADVADSPAVALFSIVT